MSKPKFLKLLKELRHRLHRNPELSGQEKETAGIIVDFLKKYKPDHILENIGGYGVAAEYRFGEGPTLMFRCDLDALPIQERNELEYKSTVPGVAHKCGHDGHMTIVAGLAPWLAESSFTKGRVVLLFQPAEETGKGADAVIKDPAFKSIEPDYIFALHNLPGYRKHSVILGEGQMTPTVTSISVQISGKSSHAAEPEQGLNPTLAISTLNMALSKLANSNLSDSDYSMITPVHTRIGTKNYGISPGEGEVHFTIRTWNEESMAVLLEDTRKVVADTCILHGLEYNIEEFDYFPSVINNESCNSMVENAAETNSLEVLRLNRPIIFGEDFGFFTRTFQGALFGLGAGEKALPLHHPEYDFDDELIGTGLQVFKSIVSNIMKE